MDTNAFIRATLGVVVTILVIAAVAVPIISGMMPNQYTNPTTDVGRYTPYSGDPMTFEYIYNDNDGSKYFVINGEMVDYSVYSSLDVPLIISDVGYVWPRISGTNLYGSTTLIQDSGVVAFKDYNNSYGSDIHMEFSVQDGKISADIDSVFSPKITSQTFEWCYVYDPEGPYMADTLSTSGNPGGSIAASPGDAVVQIGHHVENNDNGKYFAIELTDGYVATQTTIDYTSGTGNIDTDISATANTMESDGVTIYSIPPSNFDYVNYIGRSGTTLMLYPPTAGSEPTATDELIQIVPMLMIAGVVAGVAASFLTLRRRGDGA